MNLDEIKSSLIGATVLWLSIIGFAWFVAEFWLLIEWVWLVFVISIISIPYVIYLWKGRQ